MANPQDLIAQLMAQQGGAPGSPGMPMPPGGGAMPPPPPGGPPPPGAMPAMTPPDMPTGTDEAMLDNVSNQMGGGSPPPTGGMKWVSLEEDQQALMNDPSPENVQAFIEYWGEDKLPPGIESTGSQSDAAEPDQDDAGG